jgi:lanthanide-dependent methanol dehydrogenase
VHMFAGPGGHRGEFMAWDPVARRKTWSITEDLPVWSGALVTAGDVAFYGTMDRWFKAVDARDGKPLWQFKAPSGIVGQPITYMIGDTQYIAILSGVGGWPGVVASGWVDPRVPNGALGFTGAMQDLPARTSGGSTLMVFALPGPLRTAGGGNEVETTGQGQSAPRQVPGDLPPPRAGEGTR